MAIGALYVHVPFCVKRCAYCDFATAACGDGAAMDAYVEALCLQLRRAARAGLLGQVKTVYIGGGTPTHLGAARLSSLVSMLSFSLHMDAVEEFTVECNPESLTAPMVRDLFAAGVTRFSIGAQSFDDAELAAIGRAHSAADTRAAVAAVRERTDNFSLDLMCGLPGQTPDSWEQSLRAALDLRPAHVSIYPLSLEDGTLLSARVAAGELDVPDEEAQAAMMLGAEKLCAEAGFVRYEVASYARPGCASRHNTAYWTGVEYLGLGAGAASMLSASDFAACVDAGLFAAAGQEGGAGEADGAQAEGEAGGAVRAKGKTDGARADTPGEGGVARADATGEREVAAADMPGEGGGGRVRVAAGRGSAAFSAAGGRADVEVERLDARQALLEDVMLAFRRSAGLGEELRARALAAVPELGPTFTRLVELGLLEERVEHANGEGGAGAADGAGGAGAAGGADAAGERHLVPTRRGWLCGNEIFGAVWDFAST